MVFHCMFFCLRLFLLHWQWCLGSLPYQKKKEKKEAIANNRLLDGIVWWIKPESNFHVYNSTEVRRSKPTLWIISLLMLIEAVQPLRLSISQENRGCKWAALNKQGETSWQRKLAQARGRHANCTQKEFWNIFATGQLC